MAKTFNTILTDLVCLECGNVTSIQRLKRKQQKISHIKDLWCYKCLKVTKHYEVRDIAKFMFEDDIEEEKVKVKELVKNARNKRIK